MDTARTGSQLSPEQIEKINQRVVQFNKGRVSTNGTYVISLSTYFRPYYGFWRKFPEHETPLFIRALAVTSDAAIATVSDAGLVTAIAEGTVTVTAEAGGKTASCALTIEKAKGPEVEKVTLNQETATLKEGETLQLVATVSPEDADYSGIIWSTADETIATVSEDGLVTGDVAKEILMKVI